MAASRTISSPGSRTCGLHRKCNSTGSIKAASSASKSSISSGASPLASRCSGLFRTSSQRRIVSKDFLMSLRKVCKPMAGSSYVVARMYVTGKRGRLLRMGGEELNGGGGIKKKRRRTGYKDPKQQQRGKSGAPDQWGQVPPASMGWVGPGAAEVRID